MPKNHELEEDKAVKYSFFLKIFFRALNIDLIPIYIDESGFSNINNKFKFWRWKKEEIFKRIDKTGKFNLIMGVSPKKFGIIQ